jgi:uncharacterized membrane protein
VPTYTFFSSAADGWIASDNPTYATARTGGTLNTSSSDATRFVGQAEFFGYICNEVFLDFDTSSIDDAETVTSATLSLYGAVDESTTDFTLEARIYDWGPAVTTADWVSGASLGALTLVATYATSGGWSTAGYNTFTDVAFAANVSLAGVTRLVVSSDRHRLGNSPGVAGREQVSFYMADDSGTSRDPKLVVVTTAPPGPPLMVVRSNVALA